MDRLLLCYTLLNILERIQDLFIEENCGMAGPGTVQAAVAFLAPGADNFKS